MNKDVSRKTIRFLSEQATGSVCNDVTPPSVGFVIGKIKLRYASLISQAELSMLETDNKDQHEAYKLKIEKYQSLLNDVKQVLSSIPKGMSIVPTMYSRITREQNKKIEEEFSTYVRPRFLIYLAEKHAKDLKKAGICQYGINRMKDGLNPADEKGNNYNFTVDHIIERSGSGVFGYHKSYDKKAGQYMRPTYQVNHFNNFVFLPGTIHNNIKNAVNRAQDLPSLETEQSMWSISVIPTGKSIAKCSIYIPANEEDAKSYIRKRKASTKEQIGRISYFVRQLDAEMNLFLDYRSNTTSNNLGGKFNNKSRADYVFRRRIVPLLQELVDVLDYIDQGIKQKDPCEDKQQTFINDFSSALKSDVLKNINIRISDIERISGKNIGSVYRKKKLEMINKYCPRGGVKTHVRHTRGNGYTS